MDSSNIGNQAISKAAELGLKTQLDEAEDLEVNLTSDPLDLMQGEIESVSVKGEGLVMKKELRAEKVRVETNSIAINSIKAAMGNIELSQPTDARMLVSLKEKDIQNAFNCEYVKNKLQSLKLNYKGETVSIKIEQIKFTLPDTEKVALEADIYLGDQDQKEKISFTAVPQVNSTGNCISLGSVEYLEDAEYNTSVAKNIINSAEEILDLRNFELDEMSLKIRKLNVKLGKLTIEADAEISDFPSDF